MERPYISKSGKYTGTITGQGKTKQLTLDEESKGKLAAYNLKLVRIQNKPR